jgi:carbon-monoxide dehydrogenase large subunit
MSQMTKDTANAARWTGKPLPRMEDERFLTGRGNFVDDINRPGQLHAVFVRSPHAHAEIKSIDLAAARAVQGVIACYSAADIGGLADVPPNWVLPGTVVKGRPPLARNRVRHHGEAVAVVIAESAAAATDAVALVLVDYAPLAPLVEQTAAYARTAGPVHDDIPDNVATKFAVGSGFKDATAAADHVVEMNLTVQRLVPFSIEARAVNADFDPATGRMTFYTSQQIPHMLRRMLAAALAFPEHKLQVISPDVGGGFGPKMHFYPEEMILAWATMQLGRPVKWTERRRENISATTHGRDHKMSARIAFNDDGTILGIRTTSLANVGAYLSTMGSGVPTINVGLFINGVYHLPASEVQILCFYTNTTPVDAYRGAGRPEAAYLVERAMDRVAQELRMDPAELRIRNFVKPEQLPYKQPLGTTLDSGAYEETLRLALDTIGYEALRAEQAKKRGEGRLIGIGISNYTETCGMGNGALLSQIGFDRGGFESAQVRVQPDGRVVVFSGSHSHGQGHVTTFSQIAADALGLSPKDIEIVQGDTDKVPFGIGTFNSRSVPVGGTAVQIASARVAARMKRIAAHMLESEAEKIDVQDGVFSTRDGTASVTARQIAHAAWTGHGIPYDFGIGLEETEFYHPQAMSSPYGAHIAVVEIDPETGEVDLQRYVAIDDCGVVINPLLARGQVHGGVVQGLGAALFETAGYDAAGVPVAEPAIPRFDQVPRMETGHTVTPTPTNPLGAKGLGEAGTIGAPPAVANAVIDALWPLGIKEIDMPFTPERVLNAIDGAKGSDVQ